LSRDPQLSSVTRKCHIYSIQLDTLKTGLFFFKEFLNFIIVSPNFRFKEACFVNLFTDPKLSSSLYFIEMVRRDWRYGFTLLTINMGRHKNSYNIMRQQTFRKNIFLCFSIFSFFFFFIDNFLKEFSKKCWVTALVRSIYSSFFGK